MCGLVGGAVHLGTLTAFYNVVSFEWAAVAAVGAGPATSGRACSRGGVLSGRHWETGAHPHRASPALRKGDVARGAGWVAGRSSERRRGTLGLDGAQIHSQAGCEGPRGAGSGGRGAGVPVLASRTRVTDVRQAQERAARESTRAPRSR